MNTQNQELLHGQLHERRMRLMEAITREGEVEDLVRLLQEVDAALGRVQTGTYGRCEICYGNVTAEDLAMNPMMRYCLCDLSPEQQAALQDDLDRAWRIQSALLPMQDVRHDGWQSHYRYEPAGPVSGDYCDLVPQEGGEGLFFAVGDVSGKGIPSALLMAHLNASFRSLLGARLPLDEIVKRTNKLLVEKTIASHYATLLCGRARGSGEIDIVNAGHCPAAVVRPDRLEWVESTGHPVGMLDRESFAVTRLRLDPGDYLVLYTDGITEARNGRDEEYGAERLGRLLGDLRWQPPRALANSCLADLERFRAGASRTDDVTLLVLRRQ